MIQVILNAEMGGEPVWAAMGDEGELHGDPQLLHTIKAAINEDRYLLPPAPWPPVKASVTEPRNFILSAVALCDADSVEIVGGSDHLPTPEGIA